MGSKEMSGNPSLICVPIMADSADMMVIDTYKAKNSGADLVEIRLDSLKIFNPQEDLKTLIKECPLPTLFTYRPRWEGGQYDGNENQRLKVLQFAMELGADYVDVELQVAREFNDAILGKKPEKFKVIGSSHNYQETPSLDVLSNLVARIEESGADIVKIATTALDITDVSRMFHIMVHSQLEVKACILCDNIFPKEVMQQLKNLKLAKSFPCLTTSFIVAFLSVYFISLVY